MKADNLKYKIAYYTGTGSTARVADCFNDILKKNDCTGNTERITSGEVSDNTPHDLLILIFPVHAFNAPEAVYKWIASVPRANGIPAAVISVSGGGEVIPNTACRQSSIRRLEKKGYQVIYERMLVMPSNWVSATKEPLAVMLLEKKVPLTEPVNIEKTAKGYLRSGVKKYLQE